ncbi:MAG: 3-deoxy-D-manno-octulosonic acid transferase [Chlorobi bacterium]|nr:3-deoxy-D-manno-octulosonic acid transferase [Chlorobiota bacterium]
MYILYSILLRIYYCLILIFSLFNKKAKLWINGRKKLLLKIKTSINPNTEKVWFHCASLGEFEQGRPIIEKFKTEYPNVEIVLTFFSPSGYEIQKNYKQADYIFYLPFDFSKNAKQFVEIIQPKFAAFIKYEFWFNYLNQLNNKNIPVFLISGIFRKNQVFFKWYGGWYRKFLKKFTFLFVQNEISNYLLKSIGVENTMISGDTRFDRVLSIVNNKQHFKEVEQFTNKQTVLIAGSTWEQDESLIAELINTSTKPFKTIIAPHEINPKKIDVLREKIKRKSVLYSELKNADNQNFEVLIIDCIGILSQLYQYADIAYIGGGFGKGIHNILEAATFGMPIIFGPNYKKFQEAKDLIKLKSAYSIINFKELNSLFGQLLNNKKLLSETGQISAQYVSKNAGSTTKIMDKIKQITASFLR